MPVSIRAALNVPRHPARTVPCPHCHVGAGEACTTRTGRRRLPDPPHPTRVTAWARATAVCPVCQVEPGTPCHNGGWPLGNPEIHPERQTEAERTTA
ncbi:zinc finger domain-containing protein [Streptomyces sp. NBC_01476]|uniref:zinc finger domain-containing protein n=1 Tax=Streptomyces sp. NBC_01476 TaxID=2903881 RepID=UPI003FCDD54B